MKLGILTFNRAASYGAFFQAYALAKVLLGLGHQVQVIDYMPEHRRRAYWPARCRQRWSHRRFGLNLANIRNLREWFLFSTTIKRFLPLTSRVYYSLQELRSDSPELDACFFGSDQIWNPVVTGGDFDPAYFGGFGLPTMCRIAYAASFGTSTLPVATESLGEYLGLLDRISVRERSGIRLVKEHSGKTSELVLDPTLLLLPQDYPHRNRQSAEQPYILAYSIERDSSLFRRCVQRVQHKLGLPVVWSDSAVRFGRRTFCPGPLHMLDLIRNARYVVTSSFHGLALSLVNGVDFTCVGLVGSCKDRTTRLSDLLGEFGLHGRLVCGHESRASEKVDCSRIEWSALRAVIEEHKLRSMHYITQALNGG